jgi:hypothetical protein
MKQHTQLLQLCLVALAAGDSLLLSRALGGLGLKGSVPSVTLERGASLEDVLASTELEGDLEGAFLGEIGELALQWS